MKKEEKTVLDIFTGEVDLLRDFIGKPFYQNGMVVSTDAHVLMAFPIKDNPGLPEFKKPDISNLINVKFTLKLTYDELIGGIKGNLIDLYDSVFTDCTKCDDGVVECDLGHEHDCPDCDGEGQIETRKPSGKKGHDPEYVNKLFNSYYRWAILEKLIQACQLLNITELEVSECEPNKSRAFKSGKYIFVLMPVLEGTVENKDEVPVIKA